MRFSPVRMVLAGQRRVVEKLWVDFFSDPSKWWDHRLEKTNARYPDFKHKLTREALWLDGKLTPHWVEAELAAMIPGTVKLNHFVWNKRIARHVKGGQYEKAMKIFQQMQKEGVSPDKFTFVPVLNACANLRELGTGRNVHAQIMQIGFESDVFVCNSLLDMYAKCGSIEEAWRVFNKMPTRDVVSWNAMLGGYIKCGQGQKALDLYFQMQGQGFKPDAVTFMGVLNACASVGALQEGRCVHEQVIQNGFESHSFVGCCLINMYAKCGSVEDAWRIFNKMPTRDGVAWSAMILGFVKSGQGQKALELSQKMQEEGVELEAASFVGMLNACASVMALEEGKLVHEKIIQRGCESDIFVGNSLVDMYAKCGSIEDAWRVFHKMPTRDVISWNAMIGGFVKCGQGQKALELFLQMQQEDLEPDPVTFVGVLNACAGVAALEAGRHVHQQIIQRGGEFDTFVGNSLVDMYAKCGSIDDAWEVFRKITRHDVVSWNAMILGFAKCGQGQKALELYQQMQQRRVEADAGTFVGLLNACASVGALEEGRLIHKQIAESGHESDIFVGNGLVDMYAKCGSIKDARRAFNTMPVRDVVSWTAMLGGYAMHGYGTEALGHFERMCQEQLKLNVVTFVTLLAACTHAGLVDEGLHYLESMSVVSCISPAVEHYACVIDLLGRAGHLHKAENLMKSMTCEQTATMWISLLGSCRLYGNVEMGESAAKQVLKLDPENAAGYVLLSNIYAAAGKWNSSAAIKQVRLERYVKKEPGCSWIEVDKNVHTFAVDDNQHPEIEAIHAELDRLSGQMEEVGFMPDTKFVLYDEQEEVKRIRLSHHSEKLAIGLGLIKTPPGTPLRIFKNLRMCDDCHTAFKFITEIVRREIVVRDASRFHHFEEGLCSCRDYW